MQNAGCSSLQRKITLCTRLPKLSANLRSAKPFSGRHARYEEATAAQLVVAALIAKLRLHSYEEIVFMICIWVPLSLLNYSVVANDGARQHWQMEQASRRLYCAW